MMLFVRDSKKRGRLFGGFAHAREQRAVRAQGVVEQVERPVPGLGVEVNEEVAAGQQVHA